MDGWMDGWMDGGRDGGREGWREGWMEGGMEGWIDCLGTSIVYMYIYIDFTPHFLFALKEDVPMGSVSAVAKPRVLEKRDLRSCGEPTSSNVVRHKRHLGNCYLFIAHMRHRLQ